MHMQILICREFLQQFDIFFDVLSRFKILVRYCSPHLVFLFMHNECRSPFASFIGALIFYRTHLHSAQAA